MFPLYFSSLLLLGIHLSLCFLSFNASYSYEIYTRIGIKFLHLFPSLKYIIEFNNSQIRVISYIKQQLSSKVFNFLNHKNYTLALINSSNRRAGVHIDLHKRNGTHPGRNEGNHILGWSRH